MKLINVAAMFFGAGLAALVLAIMNALDVQPDAAIRIFVAFCGAAAGVIAAYVVFRLRNR